jgi:RNA-directed DNA polymerase
LANVALHGLEYETKTALGPILFTYMKKSRHYATVKNAQSSLSVIRYADDFVVIHESKEVIEKTKEFIQQWLHKMGLKLSETKTRIVHILKSVDGSEIGFKFLSFLVRQYPVSCRKSGRITLTKPSSESQKIHMATIKQLLKYKIAATQEEIIDLLNPTIKGWSNYFRTSAASKSFSKMDDYMFHRLWKWACMRHPNKGVLWIKRKYFRKYKNNHWRFMTNDGKLLNLHSDTHIRRHVKIQGTHSPYDGDTEYWTKRLGKRINQDNMINDLVRCA